MAIRIRSLLVSGPVMVPLNTGTTVRLSAGQTSDELPDVEVAGNAKVDKLRQRGVIEVETVAKKSTERVDDADGGTDGGSDDGESTSRTTSRKRRASSD